MAWFVVQFSLGVVVDDKSSILEKQSKHCVEQLLLIKQPSNEFYELAMKYGARVKKEKKKKDKYNSKREYEEDNDQLQKDSLNERQAKKKRNAYLDDVKAETSSAVSSNSDYKASQNSS